MSQQRLPRGENEFFSRHSERILRARRRNEFDFYSYAILSFLVDVISLPGRNGEALFTLEELAKALGWPLKVEILRRRLHDLRRDGWIDFDDPRRGPEAAWAFRLTGAAVDAERAEIPPNFHSGDPSSVETNSTGRSDETAGSSQPESDSAASEFPLAPPPREEKRRDKPKSLQRGDESVLGETTGETERLLAALKRAER